MQASKARIIHLISPRGFCAGVTRAIDIVEKVLEKYGEPIYVRHEIVHNQWVVNSLKAKGVRFVKEISEIPTGSVVIFSAHGVSEAVELEAEKRQLTIIDATCPLVKKVHKEGQKFGYDKKTIILIGHHGHPEMEGTKGQIKGAVFIVESKEEAAQLSIDEESQVAYITQTTLSVDDTKDIIETLKQRFPKIQGGENICYATTNRQEAIKSIIHAMDGLIVLGSSNSSNSNRLREIGEKNGIPSLLIDSVKELPTAWLEGKQNIAISAGASAPEITVQALIKHIQSLGQTIIKDVVLQEENAHFPIPRELRS